MLQRLNGSRGPESFAEEESDSGRDSPTPENYAISDYPNSSNGLMQKRKRKHDTLDIREQENIALSLIDFQSMK